MKDLLSRRSFLVGSTSAPLLLGESTLQAATAPNGLLRTSPEAAGIDPAAIAAFVDTVERKVGGIHSLMLLRHGKVYAEGWWSPYGPQHPHMLYSLSKSFTSTAVGLALTEGKLSLDDTVLSHFPDDKPAQVSENLAAMRIRHLLMMGTGHDKDATGPTTSQPEGNWVRGFLALPVENAPGSKFVYNSAATYMLSALVQKVTGQSVLEYLRPRLFEPLGILGPTWETCPKGICTGGWGLSIKTEDIAKFGQLYLKKGRWGDKQLIPESWVAEATSKHISNGDPAAASDWSQGYGYQFWRCRHGAFRGDGAFCQFCLVLPEQDAVVALTSGSNNYQGMVDAVWNHLLPAFQPAALKPSPATRALSQRLKQLTLVPPAGQPDSPQVKQLAGKTYRFEANSLKIVSLQLKANQLILTTDKGEQKLSYRPSAWTTGTASLSDYPSKRVATRAVWPSPETLVLTVCAYETPYIHTLTCQFGADRVTLNLKTNVGFGPTESPALVGRC